jgi:hypothetical protein
VLFAVFLVPVWWCGQAWATLQYQFLVSESPHPLVVLARYGDVFVTAPLNAAHTQLDTGFVLVRVPQDSATAWRVELLGRLTVPTDTIRHLTPSSRR